MKPALRIALLLTGILFMGWPLAAHAEGGKYTVKTGYLTCHEASGWGFILRIFARTQMLLLEQRRESRILYW